MIIKIKCQDCGNEFIFTENEQKWFEEHGFIQPKRCKYCRKQRKNQIERRNNDGK